MDHSEIVELIVLSLSDGLTGEQALCLERWMAESEENRAFVEKMKYRHTYEFHVEQARRVQVEKAIRTFDSRTGGAAKSGGRRTFYYLGVAASVLLLVGLFFIRQSGRPEPTPVAHHTGTAQAESKPVLLIMDDGTRYELRDEMLAEISEGIEGVDITCEELVYTETEQTEVKFNTLYIPRGAEYRVTLSDGTVVRLNSGSTLRFPMHFAGDAREVELDGEAYFSVTASPETPFVVVVGGINVTAYGTEFNINSHSSSRIETALVKGSVGISVRGTESEQFLTPWQIATFDKQTNAVVVRDADIFPSIAWTQGIFIFENKRLEEIMDVLSLWYDQQVIYQHPEIRELHFTGMVKRFESIDSILKAILSTIDVEYENTGERLILKFASQE